MRRIVSGWWVRNLRASVTCREAARLTAVERMPAVSQVSTLPDGAEGKMQARQAVAGDRGLGIVGTSRRSVRKYGGSSLRSE